MTISRKHADPSSWLKCKVLKIQIYSTYIYTCINIGDQNVSRGIKIVFLWAIKKIYKRVIGNWKWRLGSWLHFLSKLPQVLERLDFWEKNEESTIRGFFI